MAIAVPSLYFGGWLLYAVCLMVALIGNFELLRAIFCLIPAEQIADIELQLLPDHHSRKD